MRVAGYIPYWLDENDERSAAEQIHAEYAHGGGWREFEGFTLCGDDSHYMLAYPGDPDTHEQSRGQLRDETVVVFDHSWVGVIKGGELTNVARID